MIFDTLENLNQYTGLFTNLNTAIAFIEETELDALPLGKTEIDGDEVFVTVSENTNSAADTKAFETHSRYMDIHIVLQGAELCEVALGDIAETQAYDEAADCALYTADTSAALVLDDTRFLVCMVEEPHKPGIAAAGHPVVRKAVFKVAY